MLNKSAFLLLRLAIGMSMFTHGLVRVPKITQFSAGMVAKFQNSLLPENLVTPFSFMLPVAELLIGLLLLIGLFTRQALFAGGITMILLLFGTGLIESWDSMPSQLIHILFFSILLSTVENNTFAVDNLLNK
jgi:thiosulfate dehydrogenase (quinone) large subunit